MSFENATLDDLGRVIYKIVRRVGYTEEWWFKYDNKGKEYVQSILNDLKQHFKSP